MLTSILKVKNYFFCYFTKIKKFGYLRFCNYYKKGKPFKILKLTNMGCKNTSDKSVEDPQKVEKKDKNTMEKKETEP